MLVAMLVVLVVIAGKLVEPPGLGPRALRRDSPGSSCCTARSSSRRAARSSTATAPTSRSRCRARRCSSTRSAVTQPHATAVRLAAILGRPVADLEATLTAHRHPLRRARAPGRRQGRGRDPHARQPRCRARGRAPERVMPNRDLAGPVIGFVNGKGTGGGGIEYGYDRTLTGRAGRLDAERDPNGREIPATERKLRPAVAGSDVVLTLDRGLQYQVEQQLTAEVASVQAKGGMALIADVHSGDILAAAVVDGADAVRPGAPGARRPRATGSSRRPTSRARRTRSSPSRARSRTTRSRPTPASTCRRGSRSAARTSTTTSGTPSRELVDPRDPARVVERRDDQDRRRCSASRASSARCASSASACAPRSGSRASPTARCRRPDQGDPTIMGSLPDRLRRQRHGRADARRVHDDRQRRRDAVRCASSTAPSTRPASGTARTSMPSRRVISARHRVDPQRADARRRHATAPASRPRSRATPSPARPAPRASSRTTQHRYMASFAGFAPAESPAVRRGRRARRAEDARSTAGRSPRRCSPQIMQAALRQEHVPPTVAIDPAPRRRMTDRRPRSVPTRPPVRCPRPSRNERIPCACTTSWTRPRCSRSSTTRRVTRRPPTCRT